MNGQSPAQGTEAGTGEVQQELKAPADYQRSGRPDIGVHTRRFEALSRPSGSQAAEGEFLAYKGV